MNIKLNEYRSPKNIGLKYLEKHSSKKQQKTILLNEQFWAQFPGQQF